MLASYVWPLLGGLVAAAAVIVVLEQRRSPQSAALWIVFIVTTPLIAVPLFAILGFRKRGWGYLPIRFKGMPREAGEHPLAETFARLGSERATSGNRLILHGSPERARANLEALIDEAEEKIDAMFYLLADDDSGRWFIGRLTEKAREGVKVRLNLDWFGGLRRRPRRELRAFRAAGGEIRFFSPFIRWPERGHLNLRNHRKMVIADDARVWFGGRNIADEYLAASAGVWVDLTATVSGPVVQTFIDVFAAGWNLRGPEVETPGFRPRPEDGTAVLQMVPSGPDEPGDVLHDGLVNAIHRARGRVWIATPYFVPTDGLDHALSVAARRGIDVRLLIPDRSNQPLADLARGSYLRSLAGHGCRILRYMGANMHAKAAIIDDAAMIGTTNFDVRSMLLNFELALFAYDPESLAALEEWFAEAETHCEEGVRPVGALRRVIEGVFRLGAPVL